MYCILEVLVYLVLKVLSVKGFKGYHLIMSLQVSLGRTFLFCTFDASYLAVY